MPTAGKQILARLQELRVQTELRMLRDPRFRALCDDYGAAVDALEHWKRSSRAEAVQRVSEYQTLIADLEKEIFREIGCAPNGG
jgi:hypothetical protein